jgi:hypothetical protein
MLGESAAAGGVDGHGPKRMTLAPVRCVLETTEYVLLSGLILTKLAIGGGSLLDLYR